MASWACASDSSGSDSTSRCPTAKASSPNSSAVRGNGAGKRNTTEASTGGSPSGIGGSLSAAATCPTDHHSEPQRSQPAKARAKLSPATSHAKRIHRCPFGSACRWELAEGPSRVSREARFRFMAIPRRPMEPRSGGNHYSADFSSSGIVFLPAWTVTFNPDVFGSLYFCGTSCFISGTSPGLGAT